MELRPCAERVAEAPPAQALQLVQRGPGDVHAQPGAAPAHLLRRLLGAWHFIYGAFIKCPVFPRSLLAYKFCFIINIICNASSYAIYVASRE